MDVRLIDVREFPEFASGHIADAELVPLGTLARACGAWDRTWPIQLICRTDRRARQGMEMLRAAGFTHVSVLPGGMDAWTAAGKPVVAETRRPWSLERQVRVGAGSLVLLTLALALLASRYFLLATGFVGAGLVFAGVSDICMMARMLGRMPWNRAVTR